MVVVGISLFEVGISLLFLNSGVVDIKLCYHNIFFTPLFGGI